MIGKPSRLNRYDEYGFKIGNDDHITCHWGIGGGGSSGGGGDSGDSGGSGDGGGDGGDGGSDGGDSGDGGFSGGGGDGGLGAAGLGGYGSNSGQVNGSIGQNGNGFGGFDGDGNAIGTDNGYVDGWASDKYSFVNTQVNTTISTNTTESGTSFYGDVQGWGFLNDKTGFVSTDGSISVTGGVLSAGLMSLGLTAQTAITVVEFATAALSVVLGSPIGALAPMAKAMEAQGLISSDVSKALQAAGLVGQFMSGMINSVQSFNSVMDAKSMGAISSMQAAVLGAVTAYSTYNSFTSMQQGLSSLGFTVNSAQMSEFGFSVVGDSLYHNGRLVTATNFNNITSSYINYLVGKNSYSYQDPEFDTFSKMAGSILLNNYLAGGTMWNPMNLVGGNYNNAVGISNSFSTFTQMTMLQNDYVGAVLAKNPS